MIEFIKIKKDGVIKTVEKHLLAEYITAGWEIVKTTSNNNAATAFYNSIATK